MDELTKIGLETRTDKATYHGFTPIYERHLRHLHDQPVRLLEVGIYRGQSLAMWSEYFSKGWVGGIDISYGELRKRWAHYPMALADQTNPEQMSAAFEKLGITLGSLDICIDDGGHRMSQQNACIGICWPMLKSGGFYILEDLHTAYPELLGRHEHLPYHVGHLDELPTSAERLNRLMLGYDDAFVGVPTKEVRHVSLVSHVPTKSFTAIIEKC